MRVVMLAAVAVVISRAALAQMADQERRDFAVLDRHAKETAMLSYVAMGARECGFRSAAWLDSIRWAMVRNSGRVATAVPDAMPGGAPAVRAYLTAASATAEFLATAEAEHRRVSFCSLIRSGATLRYLDTLVP
ncbi:MAG TPA: hypothetical protein VGN83_20390 [Falsiroseomonas sp.]|jgi:hypothetical protein|nr:hypothetical protein [Falsiroseomonas sp.]